MQNMPNNMQASARLGLGNVGGGGGGIGVVGNMHQGVGGGGGGQMAPAGGMVGGQMGMVPMAGGGGGPVGGQQGGANAAQLGGGGMQMGGLVGNPQMANQPMNSMNNMNMVSINSGMAPNQTMVCFSLRNSSQMAMSNAGNVSRCRLVA